VRVWYVRGLGGSLEPALPSMLSSFTVMGGSDSADGNASAAAEYNFFIDPESAQLVRPVMCSFLVWWTCASALISQCRCLSISLC
jgi:hypothetical protein